MNTLFIVRSDIGILLSLFFSKRDRLRFVHLFIHRRRTRLLSFPAMARMSSLVWKDFPFQFLPAFFFISRFLGFKDIFLDIVDEVDRSTDGIWFKADPTGPTRFFVGYIREGADKSKNIGIIENGYFEMCWYDPITVI